MLNPISLIPTPYKIAGIVIALGFVAFKIYSTGAASVQEDWDAQKAKDVIALGVVKDKRQAITAAVDVSHVKKAAEIRVVYKTITKEVTQYVTRVADNNCSITSGFVRVHDAAASGTVPLPASVVDDSPAGVEVSTVAETVAENYGTYAEIRQRLIDLQDWVAKQQAVTDP